MSFASVYFRLEKEIRSSDIYLLMLLLFFLKDSIFTVASSLTRSFNDLASFKLISYHNIRRIVSLWLLKLWSISEKIKEFSALLFSFNRMLFWISSVSAFSELKVHKLQWGLDFHSMSQSASTFLYLTFLPPEISSLSFWWFEASA